MEKVHTQKPDNNGAHLPYNVAQLGVWRVLIAKSVSSLPGKNWRDTFTVFPLFLVFVMEIYQLSPELFIFFVFTRLWSGIQSSLVLRTSNNLLTVVSTWFSPSLYTYLH